MINLQRLSTELADDGLTISGVGITKSQYATETEATFVAQPDSTFVRVDWPRGVNPTAGQITQVETVVAAHGGIVQAKVEKINELGLQAATVVESKYPSSVMSGLAAMYADSLASGMENRAAYIKTLLTWGLTVSVAYESVKTEVNAMSNVSTVNAFTWNTSELSSEDPVVSITAALAILD